jgi:hypothetical protein
MTRSFNFKAPLVLSAVLLLPAAQAATMSKADYKADKTRISEEYKSGKSACGSQAGNAKDICIEEAKGKEKVARAELEFRYSGTSRDQNKVLVAKAKSAYEVAKQRCDDKAGNEKDVCIKEAKSAETSALADAKLGKQIHEATQEANEDKLNAEYKVATEKCYALAGEAKDACIAAAKAKYGIK